MKSSVSDLKLEKVLIKISGEFLAGNLDFGINPSTLNTISKDISNIYHPNKQISIVIGGGNFFRGVSIASKGMDRVTADYMGMMATIMNSLALQSELEKLGLDSRVMSALDIKKVAEPYIRRRATRHLEKGRIVILAGGTGNPYFTTDTTAALRAIEVGAQVFLKATKVDGVFTSDPNKDSEAEKFSDLTFKDVIDRELKVMDLTAITLCKENNLPIVVFDILKRKSLKNLFEGKKEGTIISNGGLKW
ncbi:MAG: UMP kinase [Candidatus Marinimicrobia bacterium]|nr:UMP kinase [Candidatus Neomarinimicrobiota bacterium]